MKEIKIEKRSPEEMAAYFAAQLAKARAEGAEEAWKFMKAIDCSSSKECEWYMQTPQGCYEMTYAEAKADFEKWKSEQGKPWKPKVGDVVTWGCFTGVISTEPMNGKVSVWWNTGGGGTENIADLTPTGKRVDLSQILEALK